MTTSVAYLRDFQKPDDTPRIAHGYYTVTIVIWMNSSPPFCRRRTRVDPFSEKSLKIQKAHHFDHGQLYSMMNNNYRATTSVEYLRQLPKTRMIPLGSQMVTIVTVIV